MSFFPFRETRQIGNICRSRRKVDKLVIDLQKKSETQVYLQCTVTLVAFPVFLTYRAIVQRILRHNTGTE